MFKFSSKFGKQDDVASPRGHIDRYEAGELIGWAFDPDRPDEAISLQIFDGQDLLGEGLADRFRSDLMEAGMGNGRHGFTIRLLMPMDHKKPHRIRLIDAETGQVIRTPEFVLKDSESWLAHIDGVDGCVLNGRFSCENAPNSAIRFAVHIDGQRVGDGEAHWDAEQRNFRFHYQIPGDYFDGMPHIISVALMDHKEGEASCVEVLRPILTPWQYLATDADSSERLYAGLPATVSRRLTTFQSSMRRIVAEGADPDEINNLMTALAVLNEGYEHRKNYPPLALPTVVDPDVSIIIPVHNKFELTYHCIASLILSDNASSYEVIVVDDCSTDKTTEISDVVSNVRVIVNEENLGFLRNCNKAAEIARGRNILLLNNDTEVGNRWLDEMLDVCARFERVGAVGAKLTYPDGKLQEAGGVVWDNGQPWNLGRNGNPHDPQWNYVRQTDYLSGAALLVPRIVWDEVGGLSDEFAPAYYEDTDLAFKIRAAGYRTFYCPHAEVIHFEGMSHGRDVSQGFKKYQTINAPKFCEKWVDAYAHNGRVGEALWRNKDRGVRFRALVIDYATPQPDKDAGSYAAIQEMRLLQAHGFKLTFLPENMAHIGRYTVDLQKMGVECIHAPFYISVKDFLKSRGHEFDLVYITRYEVAERHIGHVREYSKAKVLFNNADLHFLREIRSHLAKGVKDLSGPLATRDRELALMCQVDAILTYNETEQAVIASHNLRDDNIFKCPWVLRARGHKTPFEEREGIAFLGGYRHHPNVEAVEFFVEKVMPKLRAKAKGIRFYIYGSHPPESFDKLAADDVILKGYVESLDDVFETCRVFVAPLISGAGIKGKVLESMSYGVPSVLSPIATESTGLTNGLSAMIADSPDEWVKKILALYNDKDKWSEISGNALRLAQDNYSFEHGWGLMGKALGYLGFFSAKPDAYAIAK
ncbi:glycosyltransferase [Thioalkalivibrio sulfidiphilus]|uniref:glycosyltransferase n=1 Tax=Thioalkalivibrio sulfidiphilus TaxID=1033854 RepID=UPI000362DD6A|nr:glycosyltransferase [Thioalkalivibrio sulfidiphilus]